MDYAGARKAMSAGHAVRRALWLTSIQHDARGQARWNLPVAIQHEHPCTIYVPTKIDAEAADWEVAVAADAIENPRAKKRAA